MILIRKDLEEHLVPITLPWQGIPPIDQAAQMKQRKSWNFALYSRKNRD